MVTQKKTSSSKKINEQCIGAHVSIAGGLYKAAGRAAAIGGTTMQIFTASSRSWFSKKLTAEEIEKFKEAVKQAGLEHIVSHASYLINIGSPEKSTEKKSVKALIEELERCVALDIPYLVLHPGAHTGSGEEVCLKQIAHNLDVALQAVPGKTIIALEITAGQGTNVGYSFEHLHTIIDLSKEKKRLGVCIDTCHMFAAGYDFTTAENYEAVMKDFLKTVGIRRLKVMHINDSKTPCGSRKDRHESLGKGTIPLTGFKLIMADKRLAKIPKILETPNEELYAEEIALLQKIAQTK